ncbi:MAG: type IV pilus modification PilV family protein [Alphaproteobacteria bacterium]
MIEVALAIVVLAIGILSVFVLFNKGLDRSARAISDTQAAIFADSVLDGLRAASMRAAESGNSNAWEYFWEDIRDGAAGIPAPVTDAWQGLSLITGNGIYTNIYKNYPLHATNVTDIVDHVLRYKLDIRFSAPLGTYPSKVMTTLWVWTGEFGQTNVQNARIFSSEFKNPDQL